MSDAPIRLPKDKGWTRLGPGAGGSMYNPTVSLHDAGAAILTCDMTGQYVTRDGGRSWHMCNLMIWCDCFAFDPTDPHRVYAGANALYASDDLGATWRILLPSAARNLEVHLHGDEASAVYMADGWAAGRVGAVAIDPANPSHLIAGVSSGRREARRAQPPVLYASDDRGVSWRRLSDLSQGRMLHLAFDPRSGDATPVAWAVTSKAVLRSDDGGATWTEVSPSPGADMMAAEVGFAADGRTLLYVITTPTTETAADSAGLFVSSDAGRTWRHCGAGVQRALPAGRAYGAPVRAVGVCRDDPSTAYLAISIDADESQGKPGTHSGIVKTTDAGESWEWSLHVGPGDDPDNYEMDWLTQAYGHDWPDYPFGLGVAPTDADTCYATDMGRTIMTSDGGSTWRQLINRFDSEGDAYTTGLDVTTCYGMHFDPHHADVAFISYTDIGLHKSLNRGLSWRHSLEGVPRRWRNTCYWLLFDHDVPGRLWSVWSAGHDYPRLKMFRRRGLGQVPGGVCVSDDNGETWRPTMEGMPECGTTHIVLDPGSATGGRTLYVTAFGRGVYKSDDGGASWRVHNNGLGDNLHAWRLVGDPSESMYLLVARNYHEGESAPGGVYCTSDGAATWRRLDVSDEAPFPTDLCTVPDNSDIMYLSAWPIALPDRVASGGILGSCDGGRTWKRLPAPGEYVYALTIDPREPAVMYVTVWHEGVFRSGDGGQTWQRLEGANFGWPHRVIPDPFDPDSVYLTTYGASVWHGPKLGVPDAPRDIINLPPVSAVKP